MKIKGQEFENEMNSNDMDSEMAEMDSMGNDGNQNGGMRNKIMQNKQRSYPTAPVRDLIGVRYGVEKEDDKQMIQTRNKIQKGMINVHSKTVFKQGYGRHFIQIKVSNLNHKFPSNNQK